TKSRLQSSFRQEIVHHETCHEEENHRRYWRPPGAIGPRQMRLSDAQLYDSQHGEERAEQQGELDEIEHGLETAGEQHEVRDCKLEEDGISRRSAGRFAGEY